MKVLIPFLVGMVLVSTESYAMSGSTWYGTCSEWAHTTSNQMNALSPEKRVAYRACQIEAYRIYCELNYEGDARGVGNAVTDDTKRQWAAHLVNFCPNYNAWSMPFGGPPVFAIRELEKEGGPGFAEGLMAASWMLTRVFQQVFGGCEREREKLGLLNDPEACLNGWLKFLDAPP